jgi:hypothetical protein
MLPGTTIISNCWTACNAFTYEGYTHPNSELENNIHQQNVRSTWNQKTWRSITEHARSKDAVHLLPSRIQVHQETKKTLISKIPQNYQKH